MKEKFSEAIKLKDGILHNLSCHQARVDTTLANFGGGKVNLFYTLSEIPVFAREGLFKCRVVYSNRVESVEFIPYTFNHIETVGIVVDDYIDYGYKYVDRSRIKKLLEKSGCDDIIIVKQGMVTDAFSANLVFESKEGLFTPNTVLLQGTKRRFLIETGRILERDISVNDIKLFDRVGFINAMVDLEDNIFVEISVINTNSF